MTSTLVKVTYFINSIVEYKKGEIELVPANRQETYDSMGTPVQVYYKREKFPEILVEVGNVVKTLKEINKLWRENNIETIWGIGREMDSILCVSGEFYSVETAKEFLTLAEQFIKEIFHL